MGFFDKKYCDICGEKIGLLGNRKLEDGNCCKECAKKLSPWFSERRQSTVAEIKEQLADRETNQQRVRAFQTTRDLCGGSYTHVFLDDWKKQFAVAGRLDEETNPDIFDIASVTGCRLEIDEDRDEQKHENKEGDLVSYVPPMYKYSYDYHMIITLNTKWVSEIKFDLNTFSVDGQDRSKMMELERTGNEIVAALTGQPMNNGMQGGMCSQPMNNGMQNGMYNQSMNNGMQSGMYSQPMNSGVQDMTWNCPACGTSNTGKFCVGCGQPQMPAAMGGTGRQGLVRCDKCGWTAPDPSNPPKFCPNCGDLITMNDIR